jgi:hypothetical protein
VTGSATGHNRGNPLPLSGLRRRRGWGGRSSGPGTGSEEQGEGRGLGDKCYGTPAECSGDPCEIYKGYQAYPYEPQFLFYDPEALTEVVAGTREPREVLPYAVHTVEEVLDQDCAALGAAAYDQESGLLYVTEQEAGQLVVGRDGGSRVASGMTGGGLSYRSPGAKMGGCGPSRRRG